MNIRNLKIFRDYMASGEWEKHGGFDMRYFLMGFGFPGTCGCLAGHAVKSGLFVSNDCGTENEVGRAVFGIRDREVLDFLFDWDWFEHDNTVEGAIGRLDAVIGGYFNGG